MPKRTQAAKTALPPTAPRRDATREKIRAALQAEIENGDLAPGSWLDERELTERFRVSQTPVREALQQLAPLELVRMTPRQGVSEAELSVNKVAACSNSSAKSKAYWPRWLHAA